VAFQRVSLSVTCKYRSTTTFILGNLSELADHHLYRGEGFRGAKLELSNFILVIPDVGENSPENRICAACERMKTQELDRNINKIKRIL